MLRVQIFLYRGRIGKWICPERDTFFSGNNRSARDLRCDFPPRGNLTEKRRYDAERELEKLIERLAHGNLCYEQPAALCPPEAGKAPRNWVTRVTTS